MLQQVSIHPSHPIPQTQRPLYHGNPSSPTPRLKQQTPQNRTAHQPSQQRHPQAPSIPTPIRPHIRLSGPRVPLPRIRVRTLHVRIIPHGTIAIGASAAKRRLDIHIPPAAVLSDELRLPRLHGFHHRGADRLVPAIGGDFVLFALTAALLAFLVGGVGEFVFHFAAEFVEACWGFFCSSSSSSSRSSLRRRGAAGRLDVCSAFLVGAFCFDVGLTRHSVQTLDAGAFLRGKAGQVLRVVVGVLPNRAGREGCCVYEELVVFFVVILSYPAGGKRTSFVFHGAPALRRDAIAGFVGWRGLLRVGWWCVGRCHCWL
ncbi:hypothetical protein ACMFMG_012174 [Clarireedia jacksonii]